MLRKASCICFRILTATTVSVMVLFSVPQGNAQQTSGSVVGRVTDPHGSVVPGTQITARNRATALTRTVTANDQGDYRIDFLPAGTYDLEFVASGFRTINRTNLEVQVGQFVRADVALVLGEVAQTLDVSAVATTVNTTNSNVGEVVGTRQIINLPLVNRNVYSFLQLTPGVQNSTSSISLGYPEQRTFINGGTDGAMGTVNYYLDGGPNMTTLRNTGNVVPNPDAIQEFRVDTNNYSAEYGRFGNGVINVLTRSGTNQLHGSFFEFLRNTALNANSWGALTKPPLHRNQFGGTVGGPIVKNKTFFFATYSGLRQTTTTDLRGAVVPSAAQRGGDFSAISKPIIDPLTGKQFPGNVIPADRIDPTAKAVMDQYIPAANLPNNQYQGQVPSPYNSDELMGKIDHQLTVKHRLSGSFYTTWGSNNVMPLSSGGSPIGNLPWSTQQYNWHQYNTNVSDTWVLNDHKLNQIWLTYMRNFGGRANLPAISLHDFGSTFQPQGPPALPQIAVTGYFTMGQSIAGPTAGTNYYGLRDVFSYSRGRHNIRLGGDLGLGKDIQQTLLNNYGVFSFTGNKTGPKSGQGDAFADFLLGLPNSMNQDAPENVYVNSWMMGLFAQDDFRVLPRLTLNLGVRYDIQTPPTDPLNREMTFVAGEQSVIIPNAPAGILVAGDPGVERGVVPVRRNYVSPRLGFAWDVFGNGKTAVRGGAGIFFGSVSGNGWATVENSQPFSVRQKFSNVKSFSDPYGNLPGGTSPFPYEYSPSSARFITPANILPIDKDFRWPRSYQFNFTVQQELGRGVTVSAGYVGTLGRKLPFATDVNYPIYTSAATSSNYDSRRPYEPGLLSTVYLMKSNQSSNYNALQIVAKKTMSQRITFSGFYTYSKSLASAQMDGQTTNGGAQDYLNLAEERGRSDFDQRHRLVASVVWDISYYTGNRPALKALANRWTLSGIVTLASGSPFTVTTGKDNNFDGNNNDRPNIVGDPRLDPNRSRTEAAAKWFNTAAFVANPIGTDGNAGRNILDAPGYRNADLAIFRDFGLRERLKLQFRAEFTNAFNLVSLNAPNANLNSSSFGRITGASPMRQVQLGLRLTY